MIQTLVFKIGEELPQGVRNDRWAVQLRLASSYPDHHLGHTVAYEVTRTPLGLAMMYIAGVLSGLLGIGSGTFKVLAMDTIMRLPMKVSTTTSNFMIGVTAAASAGIYFSCGDVLPVLAVPVVETSPRLLDPLFSKEVKVFKMVTTASGITSRINPTVVR
ncbi:MAG: hypothetical protein NVS4B11_35290 [Ktedonobacteraceae bacterium]